MTRRQTRLLLACPLIGFAVLAFVLAIGFNLGRHDIHPSSLLGSPFPQFELSTLMDSQPISNEQMTGQARLVNIWASWCVACRAEHDVLKQIAKSNEVSLFGINYKDTKGDAIAWLYELGNPFEVNIVDAEGDLGVDLGVYGAPETFLVDSRGVIRYKHVGPLTNDIWSQEIRPLLGTLE